VKSSLQQIHQSSRSTDVCADNNDEEASRPRRILCVICRKKRLKCDGNKLEYAIGRPGREYIKDLKTWLDWLDLSKGGEYKLDCILHTAQVGTQLRTK